MRSSELDCTQDCKMTKFMIITTQVWPHLDLCLSELVHIWEKTLTQFNNDNEKEIGVSNIVKCSLQKSDPNLYSKVVVVKVSCSVFTWTAFNKIP